MLALPCGCVLLACACKREGEDKHLKAAGAAAASGAPRAQGGASEYSDCSDYSGSDEAMAMAMGHGRGTPPRPWLW